MRAYLKSIRYFSAEKSLRRHELPTDIANAASVLLPRSLIAVHGRDSGKFLNGLITITPPELKGSEQPGSGIGAYAALLNSKGRVLTDVFVYPAHDNVMIREELGITETPCYILDIDRSVLEKIFNLLEFHILMMDVKVEQLHSHKTWALWNDDAPVETSKLSMNQDLWVNDARAPGIGVRVIRPNSDTPLDLPQQSIEDYMLRRYLFGVPEGSQEIIPGKSLPLDSCIDYMGGINFEKGCYLGQELTIRTHHHGNVRKRVMPVVFAQSADETISDEIYQPVELGVEVGADIFDDNPIPFKESIEPVFSSSPFGSSSTTQRNRPSGSVVAAIGNVGLAKLRVDTIGHEFRLGDLYVKPLTPFWWPQ